MSRRIVSGIMLTLLLTSVLTFTFNVHQVKSDWSSTETIYIRADGSVEPSDAPILSADNVTYTLTDNIVVNVPASSSAVVVERDNIVVDGAGYILQGTGALYSIGIALLHRSNVTIKNMEVTKFFFGIWLRYSNNNSIVGSKITNGTDISIYLQYSSNNSIVGNNVKANNHYSVYLYESSNNSISGNNIANNSFGGIYLYKFSNNNTIVGNNITANSWNGIWLYYSSSYNKIYHNNFVKNSRHVSTSKSYGNLWDDGYPSGGNYWSDYNGTDLYSGPNQDEPGSDGIGDTPYTIDTNNTNRYPLMKPYGGPHDLGITSVTTSKTIIAQGDSLSINIKIINYGVETENFNITTYANTTVIATLTNITLPSRNSTTLSFTWNTSGFAKGKYTIKAIADTVPGESFTVDNTFIYGVVQVTIEGDCYPDGKINIYDLVYVARAYGTKIREPKYNPNADLNNDGKININDLVIVARNYGKTDP